MRAQKSSSRRIVSLLRSRRVARNGRAERGCRSRISARTSTSCVSRWCSRRASIGRSRRRAYTCQAACGVRRSATGNFAHALTRYSRSALRPIRRKPSSVAPSMNAWKWPNGAERKIGRMLRRCGLRIGRMRNCQRSRSCAVPPGLRAARRGRRGFPRPLFARASVASARGGRRAHHECRETSEGGSQSGCTGLRSPEEGPRVASQVRRRQLSEGLLALARREPPRLRCVHTSGAVVASSGNQAVVGRWSLSRAALAHRGEPEVPIARATLQNRQLCHRRACAPRHACQPAPSRLFRAP